MNGPLRLLATGWFFTLATLPSHAQGGSWSDGGGAIALTAQRGGYGIELQGNYFWVWCRHADAAVYAIGPELTLGGYVDDHVQCGQAIGLRQIVLFNGIVGLTGSVGLKNFTDGFSLDDTRLTWEIGPSIAGILSLEYSPSIPLGGEQDRVASDGFTLRLTLNGALLEQVFARVPIS